VSGGVREFQGDEAYTSLLDEIGEVFQRGDFPEIIRAVDKGFGTGVYTLRLLFRDEQRKILRQILESALDEAEALYRRFYHDHAPLMRFMTALGVPLPNRFETAAEFTLNTDLRRSFEADELNLEAITGLLDEAKAAGLSLDSASLEFELRRKVEQLSAQFRAEPESLPNLQKLDAAAGLAQSVPFEVNLWQVQNDFYSVLQSAYQDYRRKAEQGDEHAAQWVAAFKVLGDRLSVPVE
jgi:hypothetical protein